MKKYYKKLPAVLIKNIVVLVFLMALSILFLL